MSDLHADETAIAVFVRAFFRYADEGTFISLRAFDQFRQDVPPVFIRPIVVGNDLDVAISHAVTAAEECAQIEQPVVFAPPICTFDNPERARGVDLANGLLLSVELDDVDPDVALARLVGILGTATMIVHSGSEWTEAGVTKPKTHIHWRLSEPTRAIEEHEKLRQARSLAATLVGADPTGKPTVHPLRWPGSWNRKAAPRMASIAEYNENAEISLQEALEALEVAIELAGWAKAEMPHSSQPAADIRLIRDAMSRIPNFGLDVHYSDWIRMGYAVYRATGGCEDGFEIWDIWSTLSDKYDSSETESAWRRIAAACSGADPPRTIGAGSIFYAAAQNGWQKPHPFENKGQTEYTGQSFNDRPVPPLPLIYFSDIKPNLDAADFVENLLIEASMAVIYGESNCGKTFFMTDLGIHIAMGKMWRNREIELGGVIYCALEGSHGISNRIEAFRLHYNLGPLELPFGIIPSSINMLDPKADTDKLIETIHIMAADMHVPVRLVVIDTLSRALAGGNENAPDDMGAAVTNTDKVRQATKAAVAYVHHSGKDMARGARGHSLLRAATDTEIEVTREDKDSPSVAKVTKQRELEIEGEFWFKLDQIELGKNRRGKPVTSCVVSELTEAPETGEGRDGTKTTRLPPNAALGIRALRAVMSRSSARLPSLPEYPADTWSVAVSEWREEFYQLKSGVPDTKKHAFSSAETVLLARQIITERNGLVWFCERDGSNGTNGTKAG